MTQNNLATVRPVESAVQIRERQRLQNLKSLAEIVKTGDESTKAKEKKEICMVHIQRNLDISQVLEYKAMRGYKDQEVLEKIILASVIWFVEGFKEGGMMRTTDILKFTYHLLDFKYDSLEDVLLCFQMAEKGLLRDAETGKRIERYASMTIEILERYWASYLTHKAEVREELMRSEKHKMTEGDYRTEQDTALIKAENARQFMQDMGQAQRVFKNTERFDFEQKFSDKVELVTGKRLDK